VLDPSHPERRLPLQALITGRSERTLARTHSRGCLAGARQAAETGSGKESATNLEAGGSGADAPQELLAGVMQAGVGWANSVHTCGEHSRCCSSVSAGRWQKSRGVHITPEGGGLYRRVHHAEVGVLPDAYAESLFTRLGALAPH